MILKLNDDDEDGNEDDENNIFKEEDATDNDVYDTEDNNEDPANNKDEVANDKDNGETTEATENSDFFEVNTEESQTDVKNQSNVDSDYQWKEDENTTNKFNNDNDTNNTKI